MSNEGEIAQPEKSMKLYKAIGSEGVLGVKRVVVSGNVTRTETFKHRGQVVNVTEEEMDTPHQAEVETERIISDMIKVHGYSPLFPDEDPKILSKSRLLEFKEIDAVSEHPNFTDHDFFLRPIIGPTSSLSDALVMRETDDLVAIFCDGKRLITQGDYSSMFPKFFPPLHCKINRQGETLLGDVVIPSLSRLDIGILDIAKKDVTYGGIQMLNAPAFMRKQYLEELFPANKQKGNFSLSLIPYYSITNVSGYRTFVEVAKKMGYSGFVSHRVDTSYDKDNSRDCFYLWCNFPYVDPKYLCK